MKLLTLLFRAIRANEIVVPFIADSPVLLVNSVTRVYYLVFQCIYVVYSALDSVLLLLHLLPSSAASLFPCLLTGGLVSRIIQRADHSRYMVVLANYLQRSEP